ncbi:hypothetical protein [Mycobacterium sp. PSTR-4-N]|nr:hypothetical protein [Mycobacterium sp. PSTR-4-N]
MVEYRFVGVADEGLALLDSPACRIPQPDCSFGRRAPGGSPARN